MPKALEGTDHVRGIAAVFVMVVQAHHRPVQNSTIRYSKNCAMLSGPSGSVGVSVRVYVDTCTEDNGVCFF